MKKTGGGGGSTSVNELHDNIVQYLYTQEQKNVGIAYFYHKSPIILWFKALI